jgi:hypothetical protein
VENLWFEWVAQVERQKQISGDDNKKGNGKSKCHGNGDVKGNGKSERLRSTRSLF